MRILLAAALLFATPVVAEEMTPGALIDWTGEPKAYTLGDWTVTAGATGPEDARVATLKVERPGFTTLERSFESFGEGYGVVGAAPLGADGEPSILFGAYSGGAHCCMQSIAVTAVGSELVVGDIGTYDGGSIPLQDIDGDGAFEVPLGDGRFYYTFDAYAFSPAPMVIWRFKDGVPYDASLEPQFKSYIEAELADNAKSCPAEDGFYLGACAATLADAARLGRYDEVFAPIVAAFASGTKPASGWDEFQVCETEDCKFTDFTLALPHALKLWGYLKD